MVSKITFGQQFAKIAQNANKLTFEARFNTIQRGLLGQMNEKIRAVGENSDRREIETLQKQRDQVVDRADDLRALRFKLSGNTDRLQEISNLAGAAVGAADADGDDVLTADEATALNAARDEILTEISRLQDLITTLGVSDGGLANRLKADAESLEALNAEAGVIDPAGTDPATNGNRGLLDLLTNVQSKAANFATSSSFLVTSANQAVIDTEKKAFEIEADLTELTTSRIAQRQAEVEEIELRYGNLLRSISLAFEVQSGLADEIAQGLQRPPEKGSILNLFT